MSLDPEPAVSAKPTIKLMKLRYAGTCGCGTPVAAGVRTGWDTTERRVVCSTCLAGPALVTAQPTTEPAAPPTPALPPDEPEATWVDLAFNRPGQAAREQADAELAAMRDRTKVGAFLARALDVKTDERAWRVGAKGEESIGARLDKLTKNGWYVLHAVPVGRGTSDIDHVVIGHGGVYAINTKNHPGKSIWVGRNAIKVDGFSVPYLRNSRFEASRAERLLTAAVGRPVFVKSVLIFLTGTVVPNVSIKQRPDDVTILDRMDVPGSFRRAPERLCREDIEVIYAHARRSTTWAG